MSIKAPRLRNLACVLGIATATIMGGIVAQSAYADPANPEIKLRIIETTDIHSYLTAYDYYKDKKVDNLGYTRAASLIEKARKEATNSVLVDNGDLIQGSLMGQWAESTQLKGIRHPAYDAMNIMGYDAGNIGNHEFNFGLDYLNKALEGANFPYVNSNVYDAKTGKNYFTPYIIKEKKVVDTDGNERTIKVGYIGFTPVGILTWDADKLIGKVTVQSIVDSAKKFVPQMKAEGADIVVAIPHSGIGSDHYVAGAQNETWMLTTVPGIDAIMFGHSHGVFPSAEYKDIKGANIERGTINGVPAVMPGRWADHIGIVDLTLKQDKDGKWYADKNFSVATTKAIYDGKTRKALVEDHPEVVKALEPAHKATIAYSQKELGQLKENVFGYLALTQDDPAVKLVNQAQLWKLKQFVQENPQYKNHKLVSAAAPFKYGERHNDVTNFTAIKEGKFTIRNTADAYVYPNIYHIVEVTGKDVRRWLECAAGMFKQIDPSKAERQDLIDYNGFRTYNYDVIYGVTYEIDVTKRAKYYGTCKVPKEGLGEDRIQNLMYQGQPVKDDDKFLIATNNYRSSGNTFSYAKWIVGNTGDTNQSVIQDYVAYQTKTNGGVSIDKNVNWQFTPIPGGDKLNVVIYSAPAPDAVEWTLNNSYWKLTKLGLDNAGFQEYNIDLSAPVKK